MNVPELMLEAIITEVLNTAGKRLLRYPDEPRPVTVLCRFVFRSLIVKTCELL